jgi:hypothetical protein
VIKKLNIKSIKVNFLIKSVIFNIYFVLKIYSLIIKEINKIIEEIGTNNLIEKSFFLNSPKAM